MLDVPKDPPGVRAGWYNLHKSIGITLGVIDAQQNRIVATIAVGERPWNMALTADGAKLYVANGRSNSVSVIDARAGKKLADIPVGELPWGVVVR